MGCALLRPEGAAARDLDGVLDGLGQIGELHRHFFRRLEAVLAGQPAAVLLRHECAVGDAEQRIVRLVHLGGAEMHVVGGDQRQSLRVGEIDQLVFGGALLRQAVPLQLDIEPVAEHRGQPVEQRLGRLRLVLAQQAG